jgi:hypothetical protein
LTDWLCQAAILLRRYGTSSDTTAHPLEALPKLSDSPLSRGPSDIQAACRYLKANAADLEIVPVASDTNALKIALPFLVANTTDNCRWSVLSCYPDTLARDLPNSPVLSILPPLPVEGAGMMAFTAENDTSIRLFAFRRRLDDAPPGSAAGATLSGDGADIVTPLQLHWLTSEELAPGLHRYRGDPAIGVGFDNAQPINRARFAAELYDVLHAIQSQDAGVGNEWVMVMAHLAHEPIAGGVSEAGACKWYLISEPVPSDHLGVSAWVRDGRGGLRSVSVPGGEYAKLWRLGCAVSDALHMALDLPSEALAAEEDKDALAHPHQIEDYVLQQQLGKLRGTWIADAQVQDEGDDGLPRTIRRALDILRRFDAALDPAQQVRLVLHTEAETRSMAMRLQRKGPSDLRDRLHLLPARVLQRLPLSVLELLPLPLNPVYASLRIDLALLLSLAESLEDDIGAKAQQGIVVTGPAEALHMAVALSAAGAALRGLVASAWGVARYRRSTAWSDRLPIPVGWNPPDARRQDPQRDYDMMRKGLRDDDWAGLQEATPWQWMLALLGILDGMAPQVLVAAGDNPLRDVYEHLRRWKAAPPEDVAVRHWTWPYDDMPAYDAEARRLLLKALSRAMPHLDDQLGLVVRHVDAPVFRRHRDDSGFTDADSQQWTLTKLQFTGIGSADSVARVQRGSRRLATWTEVRKRADEELLSVHTLDDKLGRWWYGQQERAHGLTSPVGKPDAIRLETRDSQGLGSITGSSAPIAGVPIAQPSAQNDVSGDSSEPISDRDFRQDRFAPSGALNGLIDSIRSEVRESQHASWRDRGKLKSPSHMRVALMQWCVDESYSHPLAEVGLLGMGMPSRASAVMRQALVEGSAMARADVAAVRGKEYTWRSADSESVLSWPEHRRRTLLKRALEACKQLEVDLLVLPEVSVRRDTVSWLEGELQRQYPGLAVLAGTYRHFGLPVNGNGGASGDVRHLTAPLTLLWRPDEELSKSLFSESAEPIPTLRFWRGKKYRAVAANELFYPDWNPLQPLFRIDPLLDQLGDLVTSNERQRALLRAVADQMPPLRYCMELICSELFLLTSPANVRPLQQEVAAMLKRFPGEPAADAVELVEADLEAIGKALSVLQDHSTPRRTILLVPAATNRSNDYWHAGQASVLASGTATVFCNAAKSAMACGGSCFIGIDSATKPHSEPAGFIETLTPYHGWRKGVLTARADGALSEADQAVVVVDIDPVHVVTGKPRPQLLPEPMALVAYLPIVELLDPETNKVAVHKSLSRELPTQITAEADTQEVLAALATIGSSPHCPETVEPHKLWEDFHGLRDATKLDGPELDAFVKLFRDPRAMRERLLTWARDRHQQPHAAHGPLNLEPAWLDFLDVDLTLKEGQTLPSITVPPWDPNAV